MQKSSTSTELLLDGIQEDERLKTLYKYDLLSLSSEPDFEHVVNLAATIFKVPIAMISLVDKDNIWFKASVGVSISGIEKTTGLCASAILSDEIYIVEDALKDERTVDNLLVQQAGLKFYAAVPLKVRSGHRLGTLCLVDKKQRSLSAQEKDILKKLASIVVDEMEMRLDANNANLKQNQVLSVAAHELKNSLATILAYSELLKGTSHHLTVDQISDHLTRTCNRMNRLIGEMFELSKLQSEAIKLNKSYFDIAPIIGRVAARNTVLAMAKQQKLFLDIGSNIMIHADEARIEEIADNLINNAIKYSPPGASIIVKLLNNKDRAVFEVEDEGPGFTEADRKKLFLPFSKLSARPTGGETSTGIGLCVVKMLVDAHDGLVVVNNKEDKKGAKFTVTIPIG